VLDDLVSQVVSGFHGMIEQRIELLANDVKKAIGAPIAGGTPRPVSQARSYGTEQPATDGSAASIPRAD
jgi:hypothetical protein